MLIVPLWIGRSDVSSRYPPMAKMMGETSVLIKNNYAHYLLPNRQRCLSLLLVDAGVPSVPRARAGMPIIASAKKPARAYRVNPLAHLRAVSVEAGADFACFPYRRKTNDRC